MLTKEECLKALDYIEEETTYVEDYQTMPLITCNHLQKEIAILRQLINEHFDNLPLKFEELKKYMWVWVVDCKMYDQIQDLVINGENKIVVFNCGSLWFYDGCLYREKVSNDKKR